ncbi:MAG: ribonuclease R [Lachnospiraceae bacterium]|nr:ribonuclease R [Lachnospiraceae bacterium]
MKKSFEEHRQIILDLMNDELYVPMKEKELAIILQVEPEDRAELKAVLNSLLAEGRIAISKRGKYTKQDVKPITGTFISHQKGFGFVEVEGVEEDYFIPAEYTGGAFHQDIVEIALLKKPGGKRQEAKVIRIVEHGIREVVGTFQKNKAFGFVIPDNQKLAQDIFVSKERSKGAVDGHKVVVEITDYGKPGKKPEGKVIEILGHINDPGVDIMSIVKAFDLPVLFPEKVLNQAERVAQDVSEADMAGRVDLRDVQMVTIDGEDAKDLDDAVSLMVEDGMYKLGVHIADVTNYVQEHSALDREALKRGTSVYLVDRVIPMLPHALSNGICSLNEGVDRLALSCLMTINNKGEVVDHKLCESVIHSNRRMTYTSVKKILEDKDAEEIAKYEELVPMFEQMGELAAILRKKRHKRGSIDFDFPETKVILDKNGHPVEIKPYERNTATKLIEEFMLIANETVAEHFFWQETPFVYRTHETPDSEKIEKLVTFIRNFGLNLKAGHREDIHPKEIQKLLDTISGTDAEAMISRLTLRSMKQAKYSTESTGHFGLACKYYCHFTSPIRRYPDLQIHRIIKEEYRGRLNEDRVAHYRGILDQVATQSSTTERRAEEAERETIKMKKAEFMEDKIGETFEGVVSGITGWGIYVELPNTVEGLVHYTRMPGDRFFFNEATYEMIGEMTGRKYCLGQTVQVVVVDVDKISRAVDFAIPDTKGEVFWKDYL